MRKMLFLAAVAAICAGCQTTRPIAERTTLYDAVAHETAHRPGTASISGQALLRTRGGDVKTAAGLEVQCVADTPYMRESLAAREKGMDIIVDPRASVLLRRTTADGAGAFRFDGLAAGSYIVAAKIVWEVPGVYSGTTTTGGFARAFVTVREGEQLTGVVATAGK